MSIDDLEFEDAKDLISSFKSIVDIPVSQDFKKAHRFFSFAKSFGKRTMPFAEMFATALKVGLEVTVRSFVNARRNLGESIGGIVNVD